MILNSVDVSIALIETEGSYLCLHRTTNPFRNYIEFPGGKSIKPETNSECLCRELEEELDIICEKFKFIGTIKHLYDEIFVNINVYKVFKYKGIIKSKENRKITWYNDSLDTKNILPTHHRILRLMNVPRILKIVSPDNITEFLSDISVSNPYQNIRLRNIDYEHYKSSLSKYLIDSNYFGKIIVDYPHNLKWEESYSGIHYKSKYINEFSRETHNNKILVSASCHTLEEIELCNKKIFDFILLSPIVKSNYKSDTLGWKTFNNYCKHSFSPCLALGGMSSLNDNYISSINNNGFGIAGIGSI